MVDVMEILGDTEGKERKKEYLQYQHLSSQCFILWLILTCFFIKIYIYIWFFRLASHACLID